MTITEKVKKLQAQRANILGRAKAETKRMEADFKKTYATSKAPLIEQVRVFGGRYYAKVGPLLKQAAEIQNAINLLQ